MAPLTTIAIKREKLSRMLTCILIAAITVCCKQQDSTKTLQPLPKQNIQGTEYIIYNQTNVLCHYGFGTCGVSMPGQIWPDPPLRQLVPSGTTTTISFRADYTAPACMRCVTYNLTGDQPSPQYIILTKDTFCR